MEIFSASALQARRCREGKLADRTMVLHYFALGGATVDTVSDDDDLHYIPVLHGYHRHCVCACKMTDDVRRREKAAQQLLGTRKKIASFG